MFISLIWFHFFFCLFFYSQYDRRDIKILTKRLILIMPTASNTYYSESDLILTICSLVCHFNVWADIISLYSFFFPPTSASFSGGYLVIKYPLFSYLLSYTQSGWCFSHMSRWTESRRYLGTVQSPNCQVVESKWSRIIKCLKN